jgi:nitrite reductase (NADH) small subunit
MQSTAMAPKTLEMVERVNLGPADRIPIGEGRSYRLGDATIAVFRSRGGGVFAVQADCPHKGGPLVDGLVAGTKVVCPLHGFAFDLASGASARAECPALRTYPVAVNELGELEITAP